MTVYELIEALQFCDAPDREVVVKTKDGNEFEITTASVDSTIGPVWVEAQ
jgi:hypothetical protein